MLADSAAAAARADAAKSKIVRVQGFPGIVKDGECLLWRVLIYTTYIQQAYVEGMVWLFSRIKNWNAANDRVVVLSPVHGVIRRPADIWKLLCLFQSQRTYEVFKLFTDYATLELSVREQYKPYQLKSIFGGNSRPVVLPSSISMTLVIVGRSVELN